MPIPERIERRKKAQMSIWKEDFSQRMLDNTEDKLTDFHLTTHFITKDEKRAVPSVEIKVYPALRWFVPDKRIGRAGGDEDDISRWEPRP